MTIAGLFGRFLRNRAPLERLDPGVHTPLERLPMIAIDCETTGLNPRRDRIVSFAAVRIADGLQVQEPPVLDLLIEPNVEIPERATAVHGIDRARLVGAPAFAAVYDRIVESLKGCVLIGHFVGFDLAILSREAARAGKPWREPPSLDTASLAETLGYRSDSIDLEVLLARLGIATQGGRHTAAGDARMAAELLVAVARRLIGQGRGTYGGAVAAQRSPRH
jgi:DNA polymerase III epsilon subunit-like protein